MAPNTWPSWPSEHFREAFSFFNDYNPNVELMLYKLHTSVPFLFFPKMLESTGQALYHTISLSPTVLGKCLAHTSLTELKS